MIKYRITVEELTYAEGDNYPKTKTLYEQLRDEDCTEEVVCAVNGI